MIFAVVITAIIVFVVSGLVTVLDNRDARRFRAAPALRLLVGWPVAAVTAFLAIPAARSVTLSIVGLSERTA